jgi:formylmethanofuran dehydrogenase subunit B
MCAPLDQGFGEEAVVKSALERAADLLGRARFPVFGGLFTDINGATAALALAEKLGGVIDHAASTGLMRASRVMRETGATPASFGEVRNRADTVVIVGKRPLQRDPDLLTKLFPEKPGLPRPGDNKREVILLGAGKATAPKHVRASAVEGKASLPELVALLAASVRDGRFDLRDKSLRAKIEASAERLRNSAFAVFVYDPAELEEPVLHTVLDIVRHLVVTTRAAILPVAALGNGDGVNLCSTWTCGLPVRTSFAGVVPENNVWLYETGRLIENGEADALVWIDALDGAEAARPKGAPAIVLSSKPGRAGKDDVVIDVGCAGVDHDAVLYLSPISGIGTVKAANANDDKPSVAAVLNEIAQLIDAKDAA